MSAGRKPNSLPRDLRNEETEKGASSPAAGIAGGSQCHAEITIGADTGRKLPIYARKLFLTTGYFKTFIFGTKKNDSPGPVLSHGWTALMQKRWLPAPPPAYRKRGSVRCVHTGAFGESSFFTS